MSSTGEPRPPRRPVPPQGPGEERVTARRIVGIVAAVGVMAFVVFLVGRLVTAPPPLPRHPPAFVIDSGGGPVTSEADVFRLNTRELGSDPTAVRETKAHARTMAFFEKLREYPGAPPRVPHGLTKDEYRTESCLTCHLRGGYVARFGDYARVTPHPERTQCLDCHMPRDTLVGRALPRVAGEETCHQCHIDPDVPLPTFVANHWKTTSWPDTGQRALPGAPQLIPHGYEDRANCLACHAGPDAVQGIRTDHPDEVDCRQCHIPVSSEKAGFPDAGPPPGPRETAMGGGAGGGPS